MLSSGPHHQAKKRRQLPADTETKKSQVCPDSIFPWASSGAVKAVINLLRVESRKVTLLFSRWTRKQTRDNLKVVLGWVMIF